MLRSENPQASNIMKISESFSLYGLKEAGHWENYNVLSSVNKLEVKASNATFNSS